MDSYHEIDTIKIEKQKAMQRYKNFKKIANIVRTFEIVIVITLISYSISFTSSYFPIAVEFSGVIFRRLSSLLSSPHFLFLVGNIIIIILFAKYSGEKESSDHNHNNNAVTDEIEILADNISISSDDIVISDDNVVRDSPAEIAAVAAVVEEEKVYRRTKSTVEIAVVKKEFRRSETEVRRKIDETTEMIKKRENRRFEADELSNEEFRRKVEEFIEKQQRFLMEEKLAVVVSN